MSIPSAILLALGTLLTGLNYGAILNNRRNQQQGIDRHQSFIPLLGGVLLGIGAWLALDNPWALLFGLLDPGLAVLLLFPVAMMRR